MYVCNQSVFFCVMTQDTRESYEIIYSQHMWLCTSPAYNTVHMRSIIIDIRLYMKVVTSPALTHTVKHTHRRLDQAFRGPKLGITSALLLTNSLSL